MVFLPGNRTHDQYAYQVTVWTGNMPSSGTTAQVSLVVAGDDGETEPRLLCDRRKAGLFTTGSVQCFLLTCSEWLGTLSHVRVWHDNSGKSPSWFLLRVLIRDVFTNTDYFFVFNDWLSIMKGDGVRVFICIVDLIFRFHH